jgi:hypothetical protein
MANKFVWSGATGGADGSKWEDAYTSLMRDWGAEAGFTPATDFIYVRSVHAESAAGPLTITGSTAEGTTAPCRVLCCVGAATGTAPGALATGASVTATGTTDININEGLYLYGVEFYSSDDIAVGPASIDHDVLLEQCRLELTGASSSDRMFLGGAGLAVGAIARLERCVLDFADAGQGLALRGGRVVIVGGSVAFDVNSLILTPTSGPGIVKIVGVDLSALASSNVILGSVATYDRQLVLSRCLLATGATIVSGTIDVPGFRVESYHCQIGTDSDPAYQMEIQDSRGKIVTDTSRYRTGGASDGERTNPISWDMDTTAGSVRGYPGHALEGPPITAWADGDGSTSHTYRVAIASDATIQDDELWIELEGPNDAATDSKAVFQTSRVAPLGTAANLPTDSGSTWTGSGVGTKQYAEVSYTPDKPGPISVRCYMAKASDNIYVDPKIQIDP